MIILSWLMRVKRAMRQYVLGWFQIHVTLVTMISSCNALHPFAYCWTIIEMITCSRYDLGDDDADDDEAWSFRKIPQDYIDQTGKVTLGVWLVLPFLTALSGKRYRFSGSSGSRLMGRKTFSVSTRSSTEEKRKGICWWGDTCFISERWRRRRPVFLIFHDII